MRSRDEGRKAAVRWRSYSKESFRGLRSRNPESRDSGSGPSDHPGTTVPLRQPHIQEPAAFALQQLLHCPEGDDQAVIAVRFLVLLNFVEPIEIVAHYPFG